MKHLHPLIKINQKGATVESNFRDMEVIRSLQREFEQVKQASGEDSILDQIKEEQNKFINKMILKNVPYVRLKVESYIGLHPGVAFLRDDLMSAGLLALSSAVNDMAVTKAPEKNHPTGYISNRVVWAIARLVDNNKDVIPDGYTPPYPLEIDPRDIIETRDLLNAACLTTEDMVIIGMREAGCVDKEIADRLDISRSAVLIQRREIEERYYALVRENL